jgi:integrase
MARGPRHHSLPSRCRLTAATPQEHACNRRRPRPLLGGRGLEAGLSRVHRQLSRKRVHRPLKTAAARRKVELAPSVVTLVRERWLASPFKGAGAIVFCNTRGHGLDYRDVGEGFRAALRRPGLDGGTPRLSLHSFRHGFASLLIAKGLNVVFVSRQLGHANPTVTLSTYAHLFERADHAAAARNALEASYAATVDVCT